MNAGECERGYRRQPIPDQLQYAGKLGQDNQLKPDYTGLDDETSSVLSWGNISFPSAVP